MHLTCALIIFLASAFAVESKHIQFTDCGQKEINWVDVEPCAKEPCMFKKGSIVAVTADGVASKNISSATMKATVLLAGIEVEYPGVEPDLCKLISCPIKKNDPFKLKMEIEVADYFPAVETTMKWTAEGNGGEGLVMCATVQVGIQE